VATDQLMATFRC